MSGQKWPLGSEVRRKDLTGGVMLYDASRAGNAPNAAWFDVAYWRERGELDGEAQGRGTTHFIHTGKQNFVLRHYRRGGLVARVMKDRYFWRDESSTRAFAEWQLLYHLHRAGLPVPAPVACRYRRHGLTYSADLITERLMDSMSLASALRRRGLPILGWITIGRCLRSFHDLGVFHADLNAHNIMLAGDDSVYLIDFDRGRLRKPGMWCDGEPGATEAVARKGHLRIAAGALSGEADWHGLLDGYRQVAACRARRGRVLRRAVIPAGGHFESRAECCGGLRRRLHRRWRAPCRALQLRPNRFRRLVSNSRHSFQQGQRPLQESPPPATRRNQHTPSGSPAIASASPAAPHTYCRKLPRQLLSRPSPTRSRRTSLRRCSAEGSGLRSLRYARYRKNSAQRFGWG